MSLWHSVNDAFMRYNIKETICLNPSFVNRAAAAAGAVGGGVASNSFLPFGLSVFDNCIKRLRLLPSYCAIPFVNQPTLALYSLPHTQ
jgi:hypothetical protein